MNQWCAAIGYNGCPTGATQWCTQLGVIVGTNSQMAQAACTACYGSQCSLQTGDCAGYGYSQYGGGGPTWGYQAGCSGSDGRVWYYGNSYTTYGYWDNNNN